MICATRFRAAMLAICVALVAVGAARAEAADAKGSPIYVLSIWTDDADDQADALTQALRSRVRQSQGWSLLETPQSFETLAIALKCPAKPDVACLQRIGDHLRAERYLWGTLARKRATGAVQAELHYWRRGRSGVDATETYSDNLRDPSDEALRALAATAIAELTGAGAATFVVHAGGSGGAVLVDGAEIAQLEAGVARVDVSAGTHAVRVRIPGAEASSQSANAAPGTETNLTFPLTLLRENQAPEMVAKPFPVRKVVAYSAAVAGAAFLVGSAVEAAIWWDDRNKSHEDRLSVPASVSDVCLDQVNPSAVDACKRGRDALNASTLGWIFAGAGATLVGGGVYLLAGHPSTGNDEPRGRDPEPKVSLGIKPQLGPGGGGVRLELTF